MIKYQGSCSSGNREQECSLFVNNISQSKIFDHETLSFFCPRTNLKKPVRGLQSDIKQLKAGWLQAIYTRGL